MSVKQHEAFCFDSFQDRLLFFDDFHGDQIQDEWRDGGTGSVAVVDQQTGGIARITTGALNGNSHDLSWNEIRSLLVTKRVTIEIRMKLNQTTNITLHAPQLRFDANNRIYFRYATNLGDATWRIISTDGGATTNNDSGIAPDTNYHIFRIECHTHGGSHAHFYVDGVQTANSPITTNIPDDATDYFQPFFYIVTREDLAKSIDVDYVYIREDR